MRAASRGGWLLLVVGLTCAACGAGDDDEPNEASSSSSSEDRGVAAATPEVFHVHSNPIRAPLPLDEAIATYEAECPGETTPECKQLQWQLEWALYLDLRKLERLGAFGDSEDELIRVGAAADSPQLKSFALERMSTRGVRPDEHELVTAAFDDPYPLVRGVAQQLARGLPDEKWTRMLARDSGLGAYGAQGLVAGVTPDARSLGARLYPGAQHWHFASSFAFGEFFTTDDDPDEVVEFFATDGRDALAGDELTARIDAANSALLDPALMGQKMQDAIDAGQSPESVMRALTSSAQAPVDWRQGIDGVEGMIDPRYVVLAEVESFGGSLPTRVVAIFRDAQMDATALVFRSAPALPAAPDLSTPEAMEEYQHRLEILSSLKPPGN